MKHLYILKTIILLVPFIFLSCSKEMDNSSTIIEVEDPESGDTYSLTGKVRDTTKTPIVNATVKVVFDDFEMVVESGVDGKYTFNIPESKKAGYVIADKRDYYNEVLKVQSTNSDLNITLIRDSLNDQVSLQFDSTQYVSVSGLVVDQNGDPVYDAFCHVVGVGGNPNFKHLGVANSDQNGEFEVMIEKGDYQFLEIHVFTDLFCTSRHFEVIDYTEEDANIGNATIVYGQSSQNTSLIELTSCSENLFYSAINLNKIWYTSDGSSIDVSSNSFELTSCDLRDELIYFGASTQDHSKFNGSFYNFSELPVNPIFDACTPSGDFLEIHLSNGEEYNFTEGLSFQKLDPDVIGISNDTYNGVLTFSQHTDLPVNSGNIAEYGSGIHLELQNLSSGELILQSISDEARYLFLDHDGTTNSGIIECNVISSGNTFPAKIRFRLSE